MAVRHHKGAGKAAGGAKAGAKGAALFGGAAKANAKREPIDLEVRHHKGAGNAAKGGKGGKAGAAALFVRETEDDDFAELEARHHKVSAIRVLYFTLYLRTYRELEVPRREAKPQRLVQLRYSSAMLRMLRILSMPS